MFPGRSEATYAAPLTRVVYVERDDFREEDARGYFGLAPGKSVLLKCAARAAGRPARAGAPARPAAPSRRSAQHLLRESVPVDAPSACTARRLRPLERALSSAQRSGRAGHQGCVLCRCACSLRARRRDRGARAQVRGHRALHGLPEGRRRGGGGGGRVRTAGRGRQGAQGAAPRAAPGGPCPPFPQGRVAAGGNAGSRLSVACGLFWAIGRVGRSPCFLPRGT